ISFGSTTFNPSLLRKNVWSPNNSFNFGTTGWSSGITWASNWLRARSTCVEFSFIAHTFGLVRKEAAYHQAVRVCPRVVVKRKPRFRDTAPDVGTQGQVRIALRARRAGRTVESSKRRRRRR